MACAHPLLLLLSNTRCTNLLVCGDGGCGDLRNDADDFEMRRFAGPPQNRLQTTNNREHALASTGTQGSSSVLCVPPRWLQARARKGREGSWELADILSHSRRSSRSLSRRRHSRQIRLRPPNAQSYGAQKRSVISFASWCPKGGNMRTCMR